MSDSDRPSDQSPWEHVVPNPLRSVNPPPSPSPRAPPLPSVLGIPSLFGRMRKPRPPTVKGPGAFDTKGASGSVPRPIAPVPPVVPIVGASPTAPLLAPAKKVPPPVWIAPAPRVLEILLGVLRATASEEILRASLDGLNCPDAPPEERSALRAVLAMTTLPSILAELNTQAGAAFHLAMALTLPSVKQIWSEQPRDRAALAHQRAGLEEYHRRSVFDGAWRLISQISDVSNCRVDLAVIVEAIRLSKLWILRAICRHGVRTTPVAEEEKIYLISTLMVIFLAIGAFWNREYSRVGEPGASELERIRLLVTDCATMLILCVQLLGLTFPEICQQDANASAPV